MNCSDLAILKIDKIGWFFYAHDLDNWSEQLKYVPVNALPNEGLFLELSAMTLTKNQISTAGGVFSINTAIYNNS